MEVIRKGGLKYYFFDGFQDYQHNYGNAPASIMSRYRMTNVQVVDKLPIELQNIEKFFFTLKTPDQMAFNGYAQILGASEEPQIFRFPAFMISYILESNWSTMEEEDVRLSEPGDIVTIGGFPRELRYMIDSMDKEEPYELPLRYFRKQSNKSTMP